MTSNYLRLIKSYLATLPKVHIPEIAIQLGRPKINPLCQIYQTLYA